MSSDLPLLSVPTHISLLKRSNVYAGPPHKDSQENEKATITHQQLKNRIAAIPCPSSANFQLPTEDQASLWTLRIEILLLDSFLFFRVRSLQIVCTDLYSFKRKYYYYLGREQVYEHMDLMRMSEDSFVGFLALSTLGGFQRLRSSW